MQIRGVPRSCAVSCALVLGLLITADAFAQTVILVRHAERADAGAGAPMMGANPSLSELGRARAAALAGMLRDAGVTAIFVTEYKRTQETAAPLAKALKITPSVVNAKDLPGLVNRLQQHKGTALVVGHSNTVPDVIKALGVTTAVSIADADYDNLFIVHRDTPPQLLRLHFGS